MRKYFAFSGTTGNALLHCSFLAAIYILCIFLLPVSLQQADRYQLTTTDYHVIMFLLAVPSILVWYFAFFGYSKLYQFAAAIFKTKNGSHFMTLATGMMVLAWSLPIYEICERVLSSIASAHHGFANASIIIANYIEVSLSVVSFVIISKASRDIVKTEVSDAENDRSKWLIGFFMVFGILYCYLTLRTFHLRAFHDAGDIYHVASWLMLISIIAPYLYAWFLGLIGAYDLHIYANRVKGVIYRRALNTLVAGLSATIVSFITSQYLFSAWPSRHLGLNWRTIILVAIRLIGGIGFVFMAAGANKLRRIEEV